jgi:DNA repair exonuclease SbcCD ATPase subunit
MAAARIDDALRQAEDQIARIQANINRLESITFAERSDFDAELDRQFSQLDTVLNRMNSDLKGVPAADRDFYATEIETARTSQTRLLGQLRDKRASLATNPEYQHSQLVQSYAQTSSNVVNTFDKALAIGADTTATMNHTAETLAEDDKLIDHTSQQLTDIHTEALTGQHRLKAMACRAFGHKVLVWIIVLCLLAAFIISIILRVQKDKKAKEGTS